MYSATKSSVIFFSYASRFQLKDKNISVSCLAPGPVYTKPQTENETEKQLGWFGSRMALSPKRVGEIAVRQTLNKKNDDCTRNSSRYHVFNNTNPSPKMDSRTLLQPWKKIKDM